MSRNSELEAALDSLKLLRAGPAREDAEQETSAGDEPPLLALCDAGRLVGGLSFARGVQPEEAFGPLCQVLGGAARELKLVDVLNRPGPALVVERGGKSEVWPVTDLRGLLAKFDATFHADATVARLVLLGETAAGALGVWAVERARLETVERLPGFVAQPLTVEVEAAPTEPPCAQPMAPMVRHALRLTIEAPQALASSVEVAAETERFEIGRGANADLRLDVEGVSRVLLVRRGGWRLRPGPGAEGVRLNGAALDPGGALLSSGDRVELGPVKLRVAIGEAA